jgi:ubiquitin-protein ligase
VKRMKQSGERYFSVTEKGRMWLMDLDLKRLRRWSIVLSLAAIVLAICSLAITLRWI